MTSLTVKSKHSVVGKKGVLKQRLRKLSLIQEYVNKFRMMANKPPKPVWKI